MISKLSPSGHEQADAGQDRDRDTSPGQRQDGYQRHGERRDDRAHQEVRGSRKGR